MDFVFRGDVESYNGGGYYHFLGNRDVRMDIQLEKEKIRGKILAEEAEMRRELEAEVRREIREERELRRRGGDHWEVSQRDCYVERRSFEKRVALPVNERMYDFPRLEEGTSVRRRMYDLPCLEEGKSRSYEKEEMPFLRATRSYKEELPFQRAPQALQNVARPPLDEEKKPIISLEKMHDFPRLKEGKIGGCQITEVKSPSNVHTEGKQILFLAEPEAEHPGKKRKDMSSPVEGSSGVTKKLTKDWSCALCQISATSELGLQDHLKGKKHKSKQAGQKVGIIGLCSKKMNSPPNPSQLVDSVELVKSQKIPNKQETQVENNEIAVVKEKGRGRAYQKMPKKKKMKYKFYCKMCEVGAFSEEVMASHKKGKKHLHRLHQLDAKR
ncbi:uncharacterized protein LOC141706888 isoform X2 [Apium graveolens]|uniref:uncharacterized protein LOC141706888 isoform X2 n=1 Tax=Apium graveolens TaxID=4045 RepID=UPI003D7BB86E